ncbi:pterin-4-alpha-carbinolamine dehydratase [Serinibacter arcticus]|uniref:Putative pterin-4-alpha-carbinolamine dehydratase n=1 Tax=Serinibacter arcticus TaxID=1655435 RepID=A0A2U1ZWQ1_9MICO|nr:VOC family protein [Serinibacter arcticus]PWD51370.1 pterin-4-alpha-carbinolamine dehydratase [Serinibacter arcticus]
MAVTLPHSEVSASVDERHWRVMLGRLRATFTSKDYPALTRFTADVAALAQELDHHPDLLLRWGAVVVTTTSHDVGGLTERDVTLAARVSALAEAAGLGAKGSAGQAIEVAIDAIDIPAVSAFWEAVLGYRRTAPDELVDPDGVGPDVWFQQMDAPRPQRNRIHVDVTVAHDEAPARLEAALAAGGTLVSAEEAPAFWVLADVEGNEACVCTWQGRAAS